MGGDERKGGVCLEERWLENWEEAFFLEEKMWNKNGWVADAGLISELS